MRSFLLISHLKIHNANALSSPYSIGFPAMTAWLGAMHALERKLNQQGWGIYFKKLGISCHDFDLQTDTGNFVNSIIGMANPLNKDGSRPSFIEEARCHLDVTLLLEYENFPLLGAEQEQFTACVEETLHQMKFAGGDVMRFQKVETLKYDENNELKKITHSLMLGYVLIERRDLIKKITEEENKDALDALLDCISVYSIAHESEEGKVIWEKKRKYPGWLVPIAIGFQGISPLDFAQNQRDNNTPHRFAESVVTLGEFIMPFRIKNLDEMLWQYDVDLNNDLYLCKNQTN